METVADQKQLESQIIEALKTCYDPEIPVDIYEMGLIYGVDVDPLGGVLITMTLTSPHCPAAEALPSEVQEKVESVPGVKDVRLDLVWEPPWDPDRMTEAAKLQLGML